MKKKPRILFPVAICLLTLLALNVTIPMWFATLRGDSYFIVEMQSLFGWAEQIMDIVVYTAASILGILAYIQMLRRRD